MPAAEPAASRRKFLRVKTVFSRDAGGADASTRVDSIRVTFQVYGVAGNLAEQRDRRYLKREQEVRQHVTPVYTKRMLPRLLLKKRCISLNPALPQRDAA